MSELRVFSTFTGIGGFERGIHAVDPSAEFIGYSEIDKYATSVYERHFSNVRNYGDITKINADELPDFDVLVGGFPCQAFSIAGKRRGFEDTRGTLFFDLARILKAKTPRLFVFENVKGLLSHCDDPSKPEGERVYTFPVIVETLDELGYDCQWQVLNSKNHGVPQNRERIIIVGHLRGTPRPEVFPIVGTNSAGSFIRTIRTGGASSYTEKHARDIIRVGNVNPSGRGMNDNVISSVGLSSTLSTNKGEGIKVDDELGIRRLTPVECERLQAFPDDWTKYGRDGEPISDTQRYKMCGNAVTTNVIRDVFAKILREDD